jgi:RHS repeat-associated protein
VRGGTAYRIVSDWRGDVRLVLNTTETGSAAVVQQLDYDAWGNVMNLVDPACSVGGPALCWQPFGFAGGVFDVTTGIVRFGARDYDPMMRRWTQKDPIGFGGGQWNIYVYVGDDPINGSDPNGKDPISLTVCETSCDVGAEWGIVLCRTAGKTGPALITCLSVVSVAELLCLAGCVYQDYCGNAPSGGGWN